MISRNEGESQADYKARQKEEKLVQKEALRGKIISEGTSYNRENRRNKSIMTTKARKAR